MRERIRTLTGSAAVLLVVLGGVPLAAATDIRRAASFDPPPHSYCLVPLACSGDWSAAGYCDGIGNNC